MREEFLISEERRPTVKIITCHTDDRLVQPILWGIEEEGIPAEVEDVTEGEALLLAKQAAHMSALNVGIALNGHDGAIVLHHRDLSGECPLFTLAMKDTKSDELRRLGTNAARLVKGEPLALKVGVESEGAATESRTDMKRDEVVELIVRMVLQQLAKE